MKNTITLITVLCISFSALFAQWETVANLPIGIFSRHHPVTFSIDGFGYLATGDRDNLGGGVSDEVFKYDPTTDSWEQMADFPGPARGFAYGVATGGKAYMGFGSSDSDALNDLWEYDPITDSWTEKASCPCNPRYHPAFLELNNKLYVGLGNNGIVGDMNDWWEYDIATDTWTQQPNFPASGRHHPYYFTIGDFVYAGFGHSGANIYNDFYRYDPVLDVWDALDNLPSQGRVAGTQFSYNGKGYILSGQGENHGNLPTGEFWEYTPETDTWVELEAHPGGGRWAPGSFVIDNYVYFTCGEANEGNKKDMMRFELEPLATNVVEIKEENQIAVFPNPTQNFIEVNLKGQAFDYFEIIDNLGKRVLFLTTLQNNKIDITSLAIGTYHLRAVKKEQVQTEQFVILR